MNGSLFVWILYGISLTLTSEALEGIFLQNVALNRIAVQSSDFSIDSQADRAVDGNKDPEYTSGSCSHTKNETHPWWSVDLQNVYKITAVTITNRNELTSRLNRAEIWIGNSKDSNAKRSRRCAVVSSIPAGHTSYFPCGGAEGRYVTVRLWGRHKMLCLCEVEVFPVDYVYPLPNVALTGEATQSSTLSFSTASKAIDGIRNSFYSYGSCSHTAENERNPWWRVTLPRGFIVTHVKITNRGDCCAERLDGAEIRIGWSLGNNGNSNPRCTTISHIRAGKTDTFYCDRGSLEGRYVNVIIPGNAKTLTLCEVEVYAAPAVKALQNVALNKPATQLSDSHPYWQASNAVSLCRTANMNQICCSHCTYPTNPWWRVDLLANHKVSAVTITNRKDCCPERLNGAQIWIGNSRPANDSKNSRCGTVVTTPNTLFYTFHCAGMKGRFVYIYIPGHEKNLTLCGVEVFASHDVTKVIAPPSPPPPPLPPSVSVLLGDRNATVVGKRLCWSDALFFCRQHHWDLLSLNSQEEQSEVEHLLSRSPFPLTDYIWLGLRRYIMDDRWFWMTGNSMTFTNWPEGSAPGRSSSPCGSLARGELVLWRDRRCEELLNFICQSDAEQGAQRVYYHSTSKGKNP